MQEGAVNMDAVNNLAEALKQCSTIADRMQRALQVLVLDPNIKSYLALTDPMALKQAQQALGMTSDPYPTAEGYEVANVVIEALNQFVDNTDEDTEDEREIRKVAVAAATIDRIEAVMVPLVEGTGPR